MTARASAFLAALAAVSAGACHWVERFDHVRPPGRADAGADLSPACDGVCGGPEKGSDDVPAPTCVPQCTGEPEDCCACAVAPVEEYWGTDLRSRWFLLPEWHDLPTLSEGFRGPFPALSPEGQGVVMARKDCVHLAFGAHIEFEVKLEGGADANQDYVSFMLVRRGQAEAAAGATTAQDAVLSSWLSIRVHGDGRLEGRRANDTGLWLQTMTLPERGRFRVSLDLVPGDQGGLSWLRLRLQVRDVADNRLLLAPPLVPDAIHLSSVTRDDACPGLRGVAPAFEGVGRSVRLGPASTNEGRCPNASAYQRLIPSLPLDMTAGAGPNRPGLAPSVYRDPGYTQANAPKWQVFVERGTADLTGGNDPAKGDEFSLELRTVQLGGDALLWSASGEGPLCEADGCRGSFRDPAVAMIGDVLHLAYARSLDGKPYHLEIARLVGNGKRSLERQETLPGPVPGLAAHCAQLRHPALVPAPAGQGHVLFFTCERGRAPSQILAVRLTSDGKVAAPAASSKAFIEILPTSPGQKAPFAADPAVSSPEVFVSRDGTYWLWFLAHAQDAVSGRGPSLVGLAFGKPESGFQYYPTNPVLGLPHIGVTEGSAVIESFTVAPIDKDATQLVFFVATSDSAGNGASRSVLRVFRQWWGRP